MFCRKCGSQIDDEAVVCPNCGVPTVNYYNRGGIAPNTPSPVQPNMQTTVPQYEKTNGMAIAAFVVSLLSLWLGILFCLPSAVGLVLSIVAMASRKNCTKCNGLAIAALVLSIISLALWGFVYILAMMGAYSGGYYY